MRAILVDWLVDVCQKFKLKTQTLFITISLIDRYLSLNQIKRQQLQLIGVSCLMIVGKYEEIYPPTLKDYVTVCDNAYEKEQILDREAQVLLSLQFDLVRPTSFEFLNLFQ